MPREVSLGSVLRLVCGLGGCCLWKVMIDVVRVGIGPGQKRRSGWQATVKTCVGDST